MLYASTYICVPHHIGKDRIYSKAISEYTLKAIRNRLCTSVSMMLHVQGSRPALPGLLHARGVEGLVARRGEAAECLLALGDPIFTGGTCRCFTVPSTSSDSDTSLEEEASHVVNVTSCSMTGFRVLPLPLCWFYRVLVALRL